MYTFTFCLFTIFIYIFIRYNSCLIAIYFPAEFYQLRIIIYDSWKSRFKFSNRRQYIKEIEIPISFSITLNIMNLWACQEILERLYAFTTENSHKDSYWMGKFIVPLWNKFVMHMFMFMIMLMTILTVMRFQAIVMGDKMRHKHPCINVDTNNTEKGKQSCTKTTKLWNYCKNCL